MKSIIKLLVGCILCILITTMLFCCGDMEDPILAFDNGVTLILKIIGLFLCGFIVGLSFKFIIEAIFNLIEIRKEKKHSGSRHHSFGIVYNKKTKKLEEDSKQVLPFDED